MDGLRPPPLSLTEQHGQAVLLRNRSHGFTVTGASPGTTLQLYATSSSAGPRACPATLAPTCLDLRGRATLLHTFVADSRGEARTEVELPDLPGITTIALQAVMLGSAPTLSPMLQTLVLDPRGDEDADDVRNDVELRVLGSDLFQPDSDGDGWLDADDIYPTRSNVIDTTATRQVVLSPPRADVQDLEIDALSHRIVWQRLSGAELWVAQLDPVAGTVSPRDLRGELVATDVSRFSRCANGPEWLEDPSGSEVLYTRTIQGRDYVVRAARGAAGWVEHVVAVGACPITSNGVAGTDGWLSWRDVTPTGTVTQRWSNTADLSMVYQASDQALVLRGLRIVGGTGLGVGNIHTPRSPAVVDLLTGDVVLVRPSGEPTGTTNALVAPDFGHGVLITSSVGFDWGEDFAIDVFIEGATGWDLLDRIYAPTHRPNLRVVRPLVVEGRTFVLFVAGPPAGSNRSAQLWITAADPGDTTTRRLFDDPSNTLRDLEIVHSPAGAHVVFRTQVVAGNRVHMVDVGTF